MKKNKLLKRFPQLSLLSFVAACSTKEIGFAKGFGSGTDDDPVPPKIFELAPLAVASGATASEGTLNSNLLVTATVGTNTATLTFTEGEENSANSEDIYQLTSTADQYDLVIASPTFTKPVATKVREGRMFIYWNINNSTTESSAHLEIKGATSEDKIGNKAPKFFELGGNSGYDMVIWSQEVDRGVSNTGAIYILWDVSDYSSKTETIALGSDATYGSLSIYGGSENDQVGTYPPEFFQLGGNDGYDMVINATYYSSDASKTNNGAVFILWDVADYAGQNKTIDLSNDFNQIASGALAIYGGSASDQIGNKVSEFLQIGGKDGQEGYDMVIRADLADNAGTNTDKGAIYILWDVADYYSNNGINEQVKINLGNPAEAIHGLLSIYGRDGTQLGNQNKDILYGADDANGIKTLTNIDKDVADTIDIAFNDGSYTYILFGDKITDKGNDDKIDSKTIDLGAIETLLTANTAGFFAYDDTANAVVASTSTTDRVGYRFASNYTDLGTVENAFKSVSLSDADSDLAVWDIA